MLKHSSSRNNAAGALFISNLSSTASTTGVSDSSSDAHHRLPSRRLSTNPSDETFVSSLGSADDSCSSHTTNNEELLERIQAKVPLGDPQSSPQRASPISHDASRVCVSTNFTPATCYVRVPSSPVNGRQLFPGAAITPLSAVDDNNACCSSCMRKDAKIKKQADEIEQLKVLVNQLVGMLGTSISQDIPAETATTAADVSGRRLAQKASSEEMSASPETPDITLSVPDEKLGSSSFKLDAELPEEHNNDKEIVSTPFKDNLVSETNCQPPSLEQLAPVTPATPDTTMLRLCRLKQLKEESGLMANENSHTNGKRHIHVSVRGEWGYYSGPRLEMNKTLHGCVIRFDNGNLYLGDMLLYVPKTNSFTDQHGLQFHGRGTLYRKGGPTTRGLFHKHEIKE